MNGWFPHDGAIARIPNTAAVLHEFFGERVVRPCLWSSRSSDLTQPESFLLGFLKERVYSRNTDPKPPPPKSHETR
jgi:hypothetical protein